MFYVGQKVERWKDYAGPIPKGKSLPPRYVELTVSFVYAAWDGDLMIDLVEWPSPECDKYIQGYMAEYFRPIVSRPTDISIFTAMLGPTKVREDA